MSYKDKPGANLYSSYTRVLHKISCKIEIWHYFNDLGLLKVLNFLYSTTLMNLFLFNVISKLEELTGHTIIEYIRGHTA